MRTKVLAPGMGSIYEISCKVDKVVKIGDELLAMEAMKMIIPINSPVAGRITRIFVQEGEIVPERSPLVEIES